MSALLQILAVVVGLAGFGCSIVILIGAFKDEIWKGVVCLLCGCYGLYYALFEFEHEKKWPIVLGSLFSGAISTGLMVLSKTV